MSWLFASGGQSIGASALTSVLPMNIQGWFHLGWTGWVSLQSKGLSRVSSNTTVQKHQFFNPQPSLGEGNGAPLQYSCLANPLDRGAWWAAVHGVTRSQTRLSDFTFHFSVSCIGEGNGNPLQCSCLENPRDGEPGGLPSMGSRRVGHD